MKKILFAIALLLISLGSASSIIIETDTFFSVGNETYTVNASMNFSQIQIVNSDYITFNNTVFKVDSTNPINITLVYVNDDIANAAVGETILEFYANTTAGTVWFNISGLPLASEYTVNRNGTEISEETVNASGSISFSNNVWSERHFVINVRTRGVTHDYGIQLPDNEEVKSYYAVWTKGNSHQIVYVVSGLKVQYETGYNVIVLGGIL